MATKKEVAPKRPAFSSKVGPVEASVWPNNKKDGSLWFSVSFARSYKDSDDTWQRSQSYGERDCISLARAALEAAGWISQQMREAAASEDAA